MDGRTTDAGVTGILIAHLGAFGSGELKMLLRQKNITVFENDNLTPLDLNHGLSKVCCIKSE